MDLICLYIQHNVDYNSKLSPLLKSCQMRRQIPIINKIIFMPKFGYMIQDISVPIGLRYSKFIILLESGRLLMPTKFGGIQ